MGKLQIHVKESAIVKPAKETPKHDLWLSNIDLIQVRLHMAILHFYQPHPSSNIPATPLPHLSLDFPGTRLLEEALSKVLVLYYPAAGRLRRGKNGRLEIQCNGEGVLFVEAETDSTVNDIGVLTQSLHLAQLVPAVDYSRDISSYPLLLFQVTFFKCGAICLGAGIHHTFGDGASLTHFLEAWAQTTRGLPVKDKPFLDRSILRAQDPPSPAFPHTEYQPPPFHNPPTKSSIYKSTPETDSTIATLKLTFLQLKALKAKAGSTGGGGEYSTYEVLVAHIWRCASSAGKDLDLTEEEEQVTRLSIIVDGRSRSRLKLPQGYVGNALFHARPVALSSHLRKEPFGETVEKIHREIRKMNNEYLRSAIDYLEKHPKIEALVPKEGNPIFQCANFCIVDWTKKNMYELDFGSGRPFHVRHANMNDGKGFILESAEKDGSLVVTMCLKRSQLLRFERLFYGFLLMAPL